MIRRCFGGKGLHVLPNVQKHILQKSNYVENQESEQIGLEKWDILNLSICELKFDISHFFYDQFKYMEKKSKWDKEYQTSFLDEVIFLKSKGIRYTWVYTNDEGISVWKYRKEKRLWLALAEMYSNTKYEV